VKRTGFQESLEVFRGRAGQLRVVAEKTDSGVAYRAEQASHRAGLVAVIDAKHLVGLFPADCAGAALTGQELIVVLPSHSIFELEVTSCIANAFPFAILSTVLAFKPPQLVDPWPVCLFVRASCREHFSSKFRILRKSPLLPLAAVGADFLAILGVFRISFRMPFAAPGKLSLSLDHSIPLQMASSFVSRLKPLTCSPQCSPHGIGGLEPAGAHRRDARERDAGRPVSVWIRAMGARIERVRARAAIAPMPSRSRRRRSVDQFEF